MNGKAITKSILKILAFLFFLLILQPLLAVTMKADVVTGNSYSFPGFFFFSSETSLLIVNPHIIDLVY